MWVSACSSEWENWRKSDFRGLLYGIGLLPAYGYTYPSTGKYPPVCTWFPLATRAGALTAPPWHNLSLQAPCGFGHSSPISDSQGLSYHLA